MVTPLVVTPLGVRPLVVLMGPPGAGKSTVAGVLAARLEVSAIDTDELIAQAVGMPIPDIFLEHGEEHFRGLERDHVAAALAAHPGVLALGGGAILDDVTQRALAGHRVVFLDVSVRAAMRRTGLDHGRPLLALNPRSSWLRLMEQRRGIYERLATLTVDTSELTAEEVAERIAAEFDLAAVAAAAAAAAPSAAAVASASEMTGREEPQDA